MIINIPVLHQKSISKGYGKTINEISNISKICNNDMYIEECDISEENMTNLGINMAYLTIIKLDSYWRSQIFCPTKVKCYHGSDG